MFIVIDKSKIISYAISIFAVFLLFLTSSIINKKYSENVLKTSANEVKCQDLMLTTNEENLIEDNNS